MGVAQSWVARICMGTARATSADARLVEVQLREDGHTPVMRLAAEVCPECGEPGRPVMYGLPTSAAVEAAAAGLIATPGCMRPIEPRTGSALATTSGSLMTIRVGMPHSAPPCMGARTVQTATAQVLCTSTPIPNWRRSGVRSCALVTRC